MPVIKKPFGFLKNTRLNMALSLAVLVGGASSASAENVSTEENSTEEATSYRPQPVIVEKFCTISVPERGKPDYSTFLTAPEKEEAYLFYGDELETSKIRRHFYNCYQLNRTRASVTHGDTENIHFYSAKNYAADYALDKDPEKYSTYMHELMHILQNQIGVPPQGCESLPRDNKDSCRGYHYKLASGKKFQEFYREQQAAMVGDYVLIFFRGEKPQRLGLQSVYSLRDMIEERFPQAKETRLDRAKEVRKKQKKRNRCSVFRFKTCS